MQPKFLCVLLHANGLYLSYIALCTVMLAQKIPEQDSKCSYIYDK